MGHHYHIIHLAQRVVLCRRLSFEHIESCAGNTLLLQRPNEGSPDWIVRMEHETLKTRMVEIEAVGEEAAKRWRTSSRIGRRPAARAIPSGDVGDTGDSVRDGGHGRGTDKGQA